MLVRAGIIGAQAAILRFKALQLANAPPLVLCLWRQAQGSDDIEEDPEAWAKLLAQHDDSYRS